MYIITLFDRLLPILETAANASFIDRCVAEPSLATTKSALDFVGFHDTNIPSLWFGLDGTWIGLVGLDGPCFGLVGPWFCLAGPCNPT